MEILEGVGWKREDVFITNAVSCRPPDNATPKKKEIAACKKWLDYQVAMVKPKFVLVLGNVPLQSLLGVTGISKMRGKPIKKDGMIIVPTFHPSFALREPSNRAIIERDVQTFKDIVDFGDIPYERAVNATIIDTWPKFHAMLKKLQGVVAYDLETSGLYAWGLRPLIRDKDKNVIGIGEREKTWITSIILGVKDEQFVIPLNHSELALGPKGWYQPKIPEASKFHVNKDAARFWMGREALKNANAQQDLWDELVPVLEECELVGQNMKFDVIWTWVKTGHRLTIGFDTMLAHYNLNENSIHDLEHLAALYYGAKGYDIPVHEKHGFGPLDRHVQYAASDGYYTRKLRFTLKKELEKDGGVKRVYENITLPSANLFCEIEYHGVYIDTSKMADAEAFLRERIAEAEKEWNKWGKGVNMASPKQIADLLYKKLKIKCPQLTPKGQPSTSESTLNQIDHPCTVALLKFRGAQQQLSFFIDGWKPYIINNRLHPSFKLHGTVTGRPSCEAPNLQQVPRDPRIRSLICAAPGRALIEADLSQIELRIAAWLADERNMIRTFVEGGDAHWLTCMTEISRAGAQADLVLDTARKISNNSKVRYAEAIKILLAAGPDACAEINKEWKEFRKKAKAVNFGYLYGMWWKKFKIYARDNYGVNVTDEEAQASRVSFFETYPDFEPWHKRQKRYARMNGYVKNPLGRKRRLPAATSSQDTPQRGEAERQAVNSPVQSFASDLNLLAALQLRKEFPASVLKMYGTIHDAILIDVAKEHLIPVAKRILEIMQGPAALKDVFNVEIEVPIKGEAKVGAWSEGKDVEKFFKQAA
jgi:DNA polymerase-1